MRDPTTIGIRSAALRHVSTSVRSARVIRFGASRKRRGNTVILKPEGRRGDANSFTRKPAEVAPGELCERLAQSLAISVLTWKLAKVAEGKET